MDHDALKDAAFVTAALAAVMKVLPIAISLLTLAWAGLRVYSEILKIMKLRREARDE